MIRYSAFDPPEYINWQLDPALLHEFRTKIEADPKRAKIIHSLDADALKDLYAGLVRNRLHDVALKRWVKQGVISKSWLGTGEEAATIGPVHAINRGKAPDGLSVDFVAPMIRNAGACHEMGMSIADMLRGYLGTADSPTRGRDLHIGDFEHGVLAPVSPVGHMVPVSAGVAMSFKMTRQARLAMTWIGDGSTKSGTFHEGMNFAAAQHLPLIIIIQNNQVALGTKLEQYHRGSFLKYSEAYGVEGWGFDGNNVLDAYAAVKIAADKARHGFGPFLLIAETFRLGGHATHDEREARHTFAPELFEYWGKRDPVGLYEAWLIEGAVDLRTGNRGEQGSFSAGNTAVLKEIEEAIIAEVDRGAEEALASIKTSMPVPESAAEGVYAGEPAPALAMEAHSQR